MYPKELKKILDKAVKESIEQIAATSIAFEEGELDLKAHIDNEMDFYLGVVIGTIYEKYMCEAMRAGFTAQQIVSPSPLIAYNIFQMIPKLKEQIKNKLDCKK